MVRHLKAHISTSFLNFILSFFFCNKRGECACKHSSFPRLFFIIWPNLNTVGWQLRYADSGIPNIIDWWCCERDQAYYHNQNFRLIFKGINHKGNWLTGYKKINSVNLQSNFANGNWFLGWFLHSGKPEGTGKGQEFRTLVPPPCPQTQ